jgi:hypothetical protein
MDFDPVDQDDRFVVFVRTDRNHLEEPEAVEQPLLICSSYAEARRVQRRFRGTANECVIRYVGCAGGGD